MTSAKRFVVGALILGIGGFIAACSAKREFASVPAGQAGEPTSHAGQSSSGANGGAGGSESTTEVGGSPEDAGGSHVGGSSGEGGDASFGGTPDQVGGVPGAGGAPDDDRCPKGTLGDGTSSCIPVTTVVAGDAFSCGLLEDGHVKCWGSSSIELEPAGLENVLFTSLTAGSNFMCGIRDNGLAYCWGQGAATAQPGTFHALAAGTDHVCGIKSDRTLDCWGITSGAILSPPEGTYRFIAAGDDQSCAMVQGGSLDGRVTCWGDGTGAAPDFPTTSNPTTFTQIFGGGTTGWGIRSNGTAASWGLVYFSAPASTVFKTLGGGGGQSRCGILTDNSLTCWGIPGGAVLIAPSGTFTAVAMGSGHACAVKANDGDMQCWGYNDSGQAPTSVAGPFQGYW